MKSLQKLESTRDKAKEGEGKLKEQLTGHQTLSLTQRDRSKEKSGATAGMRVTQTMASLDSRGGKSSTTSVVPQNFNSYRHVITPCTTGDDVQWILHLRDVQVRPGKIL